MWVKLGTSSEKEKKNGYLELDLSFIYLLLLLAVKHEEINGPGQNEQTKVCFCGNAAQ